MELAAFPLNYSNFSKEEWQATESLVYDRSIVIKKAKKGSCLVVWDLEKYIAVAERQLVDVIVYKNVVFNENMLQGLVEPSNKLFRNLKNKGGITEKELKYFTIDFKRAANLSKLCLFLKIHKCLSEVPCRSVISNCGTPTEKISERSDSELKLVMGEG